ncbi:MAG: hypothetical protein JW891_12400 [Candidatus Lokiarchaeota archaeon]|nr:hypothetical protein [Candidatus Lokiarchaeota archaeon]
MNFKQVKLKKKHGVLLTLVTTTFLINLVLFGAIPQNATNRLLIKSSFDESYSENWIANGDFSTNLSWYGLIPSSYKDDFSTKISGGGADLTVIGDQGTYNFYDIIDDSWTLERNQDWGPLPPNNTGLTFYGTDDYGGYLSYQWLEGSNPDGQLGQNPSVQWRKTIPSTEVSMEGYEITSASLQVTFNATVTAGSLPSGSGYDNGGIDVLGDTYGEADWQFYDGDYVRFYANLADANNSISPLPQTYNQSKFLGLDTNADGSDKDYFPDSTLSPMEGRLIDDLDELFQYNDTSLTLIVGINIFCEDNDDGTDQDIWDELRINTVNLTFTYEKKIEKASTASFRQDGDLLSNTVVGNSSFKSVDNVNLNFDYSIDKPWTSESTHSKILVQLNGLTCEEDDDDYITLIDIPSTGTIYSYNRSLSSYGYINEITDYVNISILLLMDDDFRLTENITITIDNVVLDIDYTLAFLDPPPPETPEPEPPGPFDYEDYLWLVYLLAITSGVVIAGLGTYSILYVTYLKYPPLVRKIRALRRKVRKNKSLTKPILVKKRATLENVALKEKMQVLNIDTKAIAASKATTSAGAVQKIAPGDVSDVSKKPTGGK